MYMAARNFIIYGFLQSTFLQDLFYRFVRHRYFFFRELFPGFAECLPSAP